MQEKQPESGIIQRAATSNTTTVRIANLEALFNQIHGYVNAPRVHSSGDRRGYWRTDPKRYIEELKQYIPLSMQNGVNYIFNCQVTLMFCSKGLFRVLAKLSGGELVAWENRYQARTQDTVLVPMNPETDFKELYKDIKALKYGQSVIVFSQHKSGVCIYTQGKVDKKNFGQKWVKVDHPHHDCLTKIGWVPLHTEVADFVLGLSNGYQSVLPSLVYNGMPVAEQLRKVSSVERCEGSQLLLSAIQHGWGVVEEYLVDEALPKVSALMQKEVIPELQKEGLAHASLAMEKFSEICHIFLDPGLLKPGKAFKSIKSSLMEHLSIRKSKAAAVDARVYPYSMTVLAELVVSYVLEDKDPNFRLALTDREYFESCGLLLHAAAKRKEYLKHYAAVQDSVSYVDKLSDIKGGVSVIVSALHPGNPIAPNQTQLDIISCVERLLKGDMYSREYPLVLIVDITMDEYLDPLLIDFVDKLMDLVNKNRLSVHLFQSSAKLLQLGADVVPGGIYLGLGGIRLAPMIEQTDRLKKLESHLAFLLQEMAPFVHEYVKMIRENHRYAYQLLKHNLKDSGLSLIENTDDRTSYLSFQESSKSLEDNVACEINTMIRDIMIDACGVESRGSFGFSEANVTDVSLEKTDANGNKTKIPGVVRFSLGLESKDTVDKYVAELTRIGKLLLYANRLKLFGDNIKRVMALKAAYIKLKKQGLRCLSGLDVKIQVEMIETWGWDESGELIEMSLRYNANKKGHVVSHSPDNRKVDWDLYLSEDETMMIHLLLLMKREDLLEVSIEDGFTSVSFSDQHGRFLFWDDDASIQQTLPVNAQLDLSSEGRLSKELELYVLQEGSDNIWVSLAKLSKEKIAKVFGRCETHEFMLERKNEQNRLVIDQKRVDQYEELVSSLSHSPRVSIFHILSWVTEQPHYVGATSHQDKPELLLRLCVDKYDWQVEDITDLVSHQETHEHKRYIRIMLDRFFIGYLSRYISNHVAFRKLVELKGVSADAFIQGVEFIEDIQYKGERLESVVLWLKQFIPNISFSCIFEEHVPGVIEKFIKNYDADRVCELRQSLDDIYQLFIDTMTTSLQEETARPPALSCLIKVFMTKLLPEKYLNKIPLLMKESSLDLKRNWLKDRPLFYHYKMGGSAFGFDTPDHEDLCISSQNMPQFTQLIEASGMMKEAIKDEYWQGVFGS